MAKSLSNKSLVLLSRLLFPMQGEGRAHVDSELEQEIHALDRKQFDDLVALASTNHVIVRALTRLIEVASGVRDAVHVEWADEALQKELLRIEIAVSALNAICDEFREQGLAVAVIKSLDHWPDLGSDLDLYTTAKSDAVMAVMRKSFNAVPAERSWGDRLACKWNFEVPGLPELVEIHVGRMGQTGEQFVIAQTLMERTRTVQLENLTFRVPSASDRLMISTLQRMYRHFYFRLCDVVDSASLVESGAVDYTDLHAAATSAGIWEGVATYLAIVSHYVERYRGVGLVFPQWVRNAARFGGEEIYFAKDFLRVPIMPQSALLYGTQLAGLLRRRQLQSGARLSLLPWLATAALVGQKITGSDKGIW